MRSLDRLLHRLQHCADAPLPGFDPHTARIALVSPVGGAGALTAAGTIARRWLSVRPDAVVIDAPPPANWPFLGNVAPSAGPALVWAPALHDAFVNQQTAGTRLVTTQAIYLLLSWLSKTAGQDVLLLATADRSSLQQHAPEVLARRGALSGIVLHDTGGTDGDSSPDGVIGPTLPDDSSGEFPESAAAALLADGFRRADPRERLAACVTALEHGRTPASLLAAASACMEVNDLDAAARDLDEAIAQAPGWAAAHFERGKLWLRLDDMEQASRSFGLAANLLPDFGSAWANLGAALGELDRPAEALAAFERALACDPLSHQAVNNVGVVKRELGQLAESEAAFRQVTMLAPELAFGYYNLGHTLFLQGRYQMALSAYVEGQKRDAERNPVQASRLALCRLAAGDPEGALSELRHAMGSLPKEYRRQLLADTSSILMALLTHRPDLTGWDRVNAWVSAELGKLA